MTDETGTETEETSNGRGTLTRRSLIAALGTTGVFSAAAALSSEDSDNALASIGGGAMATTTSNLEINWLEGEFDERPDPGIERRFFYAIDEERVYRDTGSSWTEVPLGGVWDEDEEENTISPRDGQAVSVERVKIIDADEITVEVPSDYETVQAAFDDLSKRVVPDGTDITVNIETGHEFEGITLNQGVFSHFNIDGDDDPVPVNTAVVDSNTRIIDLERCIAPRLNTIIDAQGTGARGFSLGASSRMVRGTFNDTGVINVDGIGLRVSGASQAHAQRSIFSGCGTGADIDNSWVRCREADFTNADGTGIQIRDGWVEGISADVSDAGIHGLNVVRGMFAGSGLTANDIGADAVVAEDGATINAPGITVNNAGGDGVRSEFGSKVVIPDASVSNPSGHGMRSTRGGDIYADGATVSDPGRRGLYMTHGGTAEARGFSVSGLTDGDAAIYAIRGAIVKAVGAEADGVDIDTGDTNFTDFNAIEGSQGIIFN